MPVDLSLHSESVADGAALALLWAAYRAGGEPSVREQLVAHYLGFARIMAARVYAGRSYMELEFGDYLQFARLGLLEALDRYDSERGAKFETYAAPRIKGAILSGIASYSELQEQVAARKRIAAERLVALRGDAPDPGDPDALFGYLADLAVGLAVGFALEENGVRRSADASYADNSYAGVELRQLCDRVGALLQGLPQRQRQVLSWHYLQHMPFEEIAATLELSKGRVAQIHKEALAALRERLRGGGAIDYSF